MAICPNPPLLAMAICPNPPGDDGGGLIGAKSWQQRWGPLGELHAQRRGDGARVYGGRNRGRKLLAQQRGKKPSP